MLVHQGPCGSVLLLERTDHHDQIIVAQPLKFADRFVARLRIRLRGYFGGQFFGQFRNIHQFGPRPLKTRAKLGDEMRHTRLSTGDAEGFKQPHLRPSQAKAVPDRVVNLCRGGNSVFDQPKPFTPDRLKKPVGNMGVNFFAHPQRKKPNRAQ